MAEEQSTELQGVIESIIYQNEENGYTILTLSCSDGEYTVVGEMPSPNAGEEIIVTGNWVRHATYGMQLKVSTFERIMPKKAEAIYRYLAAGVVKGIGPASARRIVDRFGDDSLLIIEREPEKLAEIKGLSLKRATEISEYFRLQTGMRHLMEFLTLNDLPVSLGTSLWRHFGNEALTVVKKNPYLLVGEPYLISFANADRLALSLGVDNESPLRAEAGIIYALTYNLQNGHVFIPCRKLFAAAQNLLEVDMAVIHNAAIGLIEQGRIVREEIAGEDALYLASLYQAERQVADRLYEMASHELRAPNQLEQVLDRIQREQGITYAPQQKEAVELAARRQVMLLTGGPGTGKTTSLRGILALFEAMHIKTSLAAPTGRAAKRLGELCGSDASTIHRLLETGYDNETGELAFTKNADDPLDAGAVIVDETSMVDIQLMEALLDALKGDCRLVLVGDPDQLPSVGPGNLFSDLIRSKALPTVRLTEIFRQAQESDIIMNAHSINRGIVPVLANRRADGDFFFLRRTDSEAAVTTIVDLCKNRLPNKMGIPSDQIQVLSPTRKHTTGTQNLNVKLQEALNPPKPGCSEKKYGSVIFREGDRVMQIRNNYDILWEEKNSHRGGMGIFNGDVGIVELVDPAGEYLRVNFDDRIVEYTSDMLTELEPAYAMTVHKSQGSEYRAVILAALDGADLLMTRGVLYTAVTRARQLLIIVGSDEVIRKMCENNRHSKRYSGLRARLAAMRGPDEQTTQ